MGRSTPEILNGWQADHQNTPSIMTALAGVGRPNPDVRAAGDQSILEGTQGMETTYFVDMRLGIYMKPTSLLTSIKA